MKRIQLSFGQKIGGAFGIILLLLVTNAAINFWATRNIARQAHEAEYANELAIIFSAKLADHLSLLNSLDSFLAHPQGQTLQVQTDDHKCALGHWLYGDARMSAQKHFPRMSALFSNLEAPHSRLHASAERLKTLFAEGNPAAAIEKAQVIYQKDTLPALQEIRRQMEIIQDSLKKTAHTNQELLMAMAGSTNRRTILLSVIALVVAFFLAFTMIRHVTKRTNALVDFADTIAKGDFTPTLEIKGGDELGRLAESLHRMRTSLGGLLNSFIGGVTNLSASSDELFTVSKVMADGSTNMSESAIAVAAAAEEMSSNMNSVAVASGQAASNINMVATAAEEMTGTVNAIAQSSKNARGISEEAVSTAAHASERVNELGKAAAQISKVTEVITEISEQTNLLALNATIEAARAGEAGKGFAVVANEIKELANQTAVATQDIKTEISGIQNTTNATVDEINQISEVINRVNEIVDSIASAVEEQSATTRQISANVDQASQGLQEVNVNISQSSTVSTEIARDIAVVSQVAGELSKSSATVSTNAEDLTGFTSRLRDQVGAFRLPADDVSSTASYTTGRSNREIPDLITWNDSIKVNVSQFDRQHKNLVEMINKLHRAMKTGQAGSAIKGILSELVDYTKTHFRAEEDLMRRHGFEGLAKQEKQHQALMEKVAATQEKIAAGNAMLSMEVMDFLKKWLVHHIQGEDKQYGPFFNAKGIF
jgi:methyl-accepting chemotaxis protein